MPVMATALRFVALPCFMLCAYLRHDCRHADAMPIRATLIRFMMIWSATLPIYVGQQQMLRPDAMPRLYAISLITRQRHTPYAFRCCFAATRVSLIAAIITTLYYAILRSIDFLRLRRRR